MTDMRLQKYLALCGVASRRKAEEIITQGRVVVNGGIVTELGSKVKKDDIITVDGKLVVPDKEMVYIMLNKPVGFITTVKDQFNRKSVLDLVKIEGKRIYPAGRLDYDTSGLLILTNDGDFTYDITHPGNAVDKVYHAEIAGIPTAEEIRKFEKGLLIEDYKTSPASFRILKNRGKSVLAEIIIHEGKNRQIRKMITAIGHEVVSLKRVAIGGLKLGNLREGKWKYLNKQDLDKL